MGTNYASRMAEILHESFFQYGIILLGGDNSLTVVNASPLNWPIKSVNFAVFGKSGKLPTWDWNFSQKPSHSVILPSNIGSSKSGSLEHKAECVVEDKGSEDVLRFLSNLDKENLCLAILQRLTDVTSLTSSKKASCWFSSLISSRTMLRSCLSKSRQLLNSALRADAIDFSVERTSSERAVSSKNTAASLKVFVKVRRVYLLSNFNFSRGDFSIVKQQSRSWSRHQFV